MKPTLPLLMLMALLSACGGGISSVPPVAQQIGTPAAVPGAGAGAGAGAATPVSASPALRVWVTAAVLNDSGAATSASLHFSDMAGGLSAQGFSVSVDSVPAGVSLQVLPISTGTDGLTLPLSVQAGSLAAQGDAWLKIHLNGQTQLVRLPVLRASSLKLPEVGDSPVQTAASAPCGPDMLLSAPVNAPMEQRNRLLRVNTATGAVQSYELGLAATEGVTSQLCDPDGTIWLTIRSDGAQGSVIARLRPDTGRLDRFPVGAAADTLNNLTRTPDGRLWFVQYKHDRLGEFDPHTGSVTGHAVDENAENLRLGQDGALYYSQFYAHPAVVRFDPVSGSSEVLSVGASGINLPRASVQTGGFVWYVDAWTQRLTRIDPATRQLSVARLPAGATPGELVAAQDGTLWVADAARHVLYRLSAGSLDALTVPLAGSGDGPRALSMGTDGRLWYESSGRWVGQQ